MPEVNSNSLERERAYVANETGSGGGARLVMENELESCSRTHRRDGGCDVVAAECKAVRERAGVLLELALRRPGELVLSRLGVAALVGFEAHAYEFPGNVDEVFSREQTVLRAGVTRSEDT